MKGLALTLGVVAVLVYTAGKSQMKALQRISVTNPGISIDTKNTNLNQLVLQIKLDVYNPNSTTVSFDYFQGFVNRKGTRLGEFVFDGKGKNINIEARHTTRIPFVVRLNNLGVVRSLIDIINNGVSNLVLDVDGIFTAASFDVPVQFSYDLAKQKLI